MGIFGWEAREQDFELTLQVWHVLFEVLFNVLFDSLHSLIPCPLVRTRIVFSISLLVRIILSRTFLTPSRQVAVFSDNILLTRESSRTGGGQIFSEEFQQIDWNWLWARVRRCRVLEALEQISAATHSEASLLFRLCSVNWLEFSEERHCESKLKLLESLSLVNSGSSLSFCVASVSVRFRRKWSFMQMILHYYWP